MNYQLLQKMGLGNIDITYLFLVMLILLLIFMIMTIVLLVKTNKLIKKYKRFMKGENAKSLENDIIEMFERQVEIEETPSKNSEDIKLLYKKFKTRITMDLLSILSTVQMAVIPTRRK